MKNHSTFRLSLVAAALTAVYGPALAADANDEVRQFASPDSRIGIGLGNLAGDNQQLGRYNGLSRSATSLLVDTDVRMRDDATGTWTTVTARNVGRDNAEFNLGYGQQGNWGASFDFNQISSENPLTFITGVRGIGSSTLRYGTPGLNTAAAQAGLYRANDEVHLGTKRDISKLNISKELMPDLTLSFSFRNDDKKGTQLWGRGSNPEFAVQPIDTKTQQADLILNYVTKDLQLMGGISGSWFSNSHSYVDTIGGSTTSPGTAPNQTFGHTFLSLPLDNQAYSVFLDGGYNFSKDTRASFKMSWQRATQDDSLSKMAGAINASGALGSSAVWPTAPHSLNGEVDTTMLNVGIVSKLMDKLTVSAKYDYNKRDDQTPTYLISSPATGQHNNPESFKKDSLRLEGIYRLPDGYSLTGGYDEEWRKHDLAFENDGAFEGTVKMRQKTDEKTWRLQLRKAMSETLTGSVSYLHSKREGSHWNPPETEVAVINGGAPVAGSVYTDVSSITTAWTNPFAFANRTRNKWRLMADWSPLEKVSLQFVYENSKDDYSSAKSGLQEGKGELFSVDATVALDDNWQLNAWGSHDFSEAKQRVITYDPRTAGVAPNQLRDAAGNPYAAGTLGATGWLCSSANTTAGNCTTDLLSNMNLKDTGNNAGFSLKGKLTASLTVGANAQWTETKSEYPTNSNVPLYNTGTNATVAAAGAANRSKQGLPDITNTTTKIGLFGEYAVQKDADIRLDVIHTRFKTDDWTFSEWNSAGSGLVPLQYMDGTKVYQKSVQSAYFVGARYTYKFQ